MKKFKDTWVYQQWMLEIEWEKYEKMTHPIERAIQLRNLDLIAHRVVQLSPTGEIGSVV